jgi:hypothetical protein
MKIWNVRLGFATNSSSSHSLIFLKNIKDDIDDKNYFGWECFTAASKELKQNYLAATLYSNLAHVSDKNTAINIVKEWCAINETERELAITEEIVDNDTKEFDITIDHQSIYSLPLNWEESSIDENFFKDFKDFLLQDELVILGGNDNGDEHPLSNGSFKLNLEKDVKPSSVAKKDDNFWTIFNRRNGAKVRLSFEKPEQKLEKPIKSSTPELIDIKITDYCPFNCEYCYQGSTIKGRHADLNNIQKIVDAAANMKVFEVALGGGETTLHPEFLTILQMFKKKNVIPNFTTKSLKWLKSENADEILKTCGSFAFSVECINDINELSKYEFGYGSEKPSIQYVMGSTDIETFKKILDITAKSGHKITLLGYKQTGRGHNFKPFNYSNWFEIVKEKTESEYIRIAIDTALASESIHTLQEEVYEFSYFTDEGKFSMYIDAVENKIGPSSYCEQLKMKKLNKDENFTAQILNHYSKW